MKASSEKKALYKLKSTQFLNRNIGMYNDKQLAFIMKELKDFFIFFGYINNEEDPDNKTPFFKYEKSDLTQDDIKQYYGFKAHNTKTLAALGKGEITKAFQICDETKIELLI